MANKNKQVKAEIKKLVKKSEKESNQAIDRVKKLVEELENNVVRDLNKIPKEDWITGNVKKINKIAEKHINDFTKEYIKQTDKDLDQAWELGEEFVDVPLSVVGVKLKEATVLWWERWDKVIPLAEAQADLDPLLFLSTQLIKNLGEETKKNVSSQLILGLTGGAAPFDIIQGIQSELGDKTLFKAERITRTEWTRAQNIATQKRQEQAEDEVKGLQKQWIWSGVSRLDHAAINGQVRDIDQPFDVGGEQLMHPVDPAGSAEQTINCGCISVPFKRNWGS